MMAGIYNFHNIIIFAFINVNLVLGTSVNSCTNSKGILPNVTVSIGYKGNECASTPCQVIQGCPVILQANFIAPRYLESLKPEIIANAVGATINFPMGQDNACKGIINTQCPIVEKEKVNYVYSLTLPPILPEIGVQLRMSIKDLDLNEDVICFSIDAEVKNTDCPHE